MSFSSFYKKLNTYDSRKDEEEEADSIMLEASQLSSNYTFDKTNLKTYIDSGEFYSSQMSQKYLLAYQKYKKIKNNFKSKIALYKCLSCIKENELNFISMIEILILTYNLYCDDFPVNYNKCASIQENIGDILFKYKKTSWSHYIIAWNDILKSDSSSNELKKKILVKVINSLILTNNICHINVTIDYIKILLKLNDSNSYFFLMLLCYLVQSVKSDIIEIINNYENKINFIETIEYKLIVDLMSIDKTNFNVVNEKIKEYYHIKSFTEYENILIKIICNNFNL